MTKPVCVREGGQGASLFWRNISSLVCSGEGGEGLGGVKKNNILGREKSDDSSDYIL